MTGQVLLIEDDEALRSSLAQTIDLAGMTPLAMASFVQAKRSIRSNFTGVVLTDIQMPHQDGFDVLGFAQSVDKDLPVILLTGHSNVPTAMRALREGAYDYLEKPCSTERLIEVLGRALSHRSLVLKSRRIERALIRSDPIASLFPGKGQATQALCSALRQVAGTRSHVHLFGAAGTGKKQAAYALNQAADEPCAFLSLNLSLTGENAIADLKVPDGPWDLSLKHFDLATARQQGDLSKLLQDCPGLRLISSSVHPLRSMRDTTLTDDAELLAATIEIRMPTLAERREDLAEIFEFLLRQTIRSLESDMPEIPDTVLQEVAMRPWPGNLPELRAFAMSFALGKQVQVGPVRNLTLAEQLDAFEKLVLSETLKRTGGRAAEAAKSLGLPRNTFYDRLARYGLSAKDFRPAPPEG